MAQPIVFIEHAQKATLLSMRNLAWFLADARSASFLFPSTFSVCASGYGAVCGEGDRNADDEDGQSRSHANGTAPTRPQGD